MRQITALVRRFVVLITLTIFIALSGCVYGDDNPGAELVVGMIIELYQRATDDDGADDSTRYRRARGRDLDSDDDDSEYEYRRARGRDLDSDEEDSES